MANKKRLIDADALLAFEKMDAELCASCGEEHTANDIIMMIKTAPTVDAVEVVRCRECIKGFRKTEKSKLNIYWCDKWRNIMRDCDFCSYGERRTNGLSLSGNPTVR